MRPFNLNIPALVMTSTALILIGGVPAQARGLDHRIEASAKESYNFKTYLKDDTIQVESTAGVVTLTGTVAQEDHRILAQETVSGLPGVKSVNNKLAVAADQPAERSDAWITMKVKTALAFHKNVSATDTEVNTQDGNVTLTGTADSPARKELAGEYAADVEGVNEVRNELAVKADKPAHEGMGQKVDDASITAQIKTTLLFRKATHSLATRVKTREGVVTLHGEARDEAERTLVTRIAHDVHGVKHVDNHMTIRQS